MVKKRILIPSVILIILLSLFVVFLFSYSLVWKPALISYKLSCVFDGNDTEIKNQGFVILGLTTLTIDPKTNETKIDVIISNKGDIGAAKHEFIHVQQFQDNQICSCNKPVCRYFNEASAYFGQRLSDNIYIKIYGDYRILL